MYQSPLTPAQALSVGFARLLNGPAPYYAALMHGLIRREVSTDPQLSTIAVSSDGILVYNPVFVQALQPDELATVLEHEAMHLMLDAFGRCKAMLADPQLFNIAQDLVINASLRRAGRKFPGGVYAPALPENYGVGDNLTTEETYRLLLEQQQKQQKAGGGGGGGVGQPQGKQQKGKQQSGNGVMNGACGSCGAKHEDSKATKGVEGRSQAEVEGWRREVAEKVRERQQKGGARDDVPNRGTIPDILDRIVEGILAPPKIDWRTHLARVLRGAVGYKAGHVDLGWARPSRRQAGVGFGAGRAVLPAMRAPIPRVGCIIDTSGSMGGETLQEGLQEVAGVLQAVGADVSFAVVDAELHGLRQVRTWQEAGQMLVGGGGTDMRPGFDALGRQRQRPDFVVVLTDGCLGSGVPQVKPEWAQEVVFVLLGPHQMKPCDWGTHIYVTADGADEKRVA